MKAIYNAVQSLSFLFFFCHNRKLLKKPQVMKRKMGRKYKKITLYGTALDLTIVRLRRTASGILRQKVIAHKMRRRKSSAEEEVENEIRFG